MESYTSCKFLLLTLTFDFFDFILKKQTKQNKTESHYAVQACLIPAMQSSCLCLRFTKAEITDMDHHVLLSSFVFAEKVSEGHCAFRRKPEITSSVFFTTEYKVSTSKCFFLSHWMLMLSILSSLNFRAQHKVRPSCFSWIWHQTI